MKTDNLNNFIKGWVIGSFDPSLFQTDDFEISIKREKDKIHVVINDSEKKAVLDKLVTEGESLEVTL